LRPARGLAATFERERLGAGYGRRRDPADLGDLGRRTIVERFLDALKPSSILICWID
jgi:hypothetical protein